MEKTEIKDLILNVLQQVEIGTSNSGNRCIKDIDDVVNDLFRIFESESTPPSDRKEVSEEKIKELVDKFISNWHEANPTLDKHFYWSGVNDGAYLVMDFLSNISPSKSEAKSAEDVSDEMIEAEIGKSVSSSNDQYDQRIGFRKGAKWMRSQFKPHSEDTAVEFAEWIVRKTEKEDKLYLLSKGWRYMGSDYITTTELYNLFLKERR